MIDDFDTILNLVGALDNTLGADTPRERFRKYLAGLTELGFVRDAVQTCTTHSGPQYARALQDLVNYLGSLMGFQVEFGWYAGVQGQVGHDGLWRSREHVVVVEVKTTDASAIRTDVLSSYIDSLRSDGRISADDRVIGLYVCARVDPDVKQLERAIVAEKRTQELRVGSVGAVLSLAELIREEIISHDEALAILWPSVVWIDDTVGLLQRIAAGALEVSEPAPAAGGPVAAAAGLTRPAHQAPPALPAAPPRQRHYYLIPVADIPDETARETIERLIRWNSMWAFGQNTPNRSKIQPGDHVAFYQASVGVVATAEVGSVPEDKPMPAIVKEPLKYRWTFQLKDPRLFLDRPIAIDAVMRAKLDGFSGRDRGKAWGLFVSATSLVTEHDFKLLTGTA
ncbi:MAG: EVE domain-containing protein [Candidatus Limnocylindrales bacterium]|jgi:hypothetical protein